MYLSFMPNSVPFREGGFIAPYRPFEPGICATLLGAQALVAPVVQTLAAWTSERRSQRIYSTHTDTGVALVKGMAVN